METYIKDPGSSLTHLFGLLFSIIMTPVLLIHAAGHGASLHVLICLAIFMAGSMLLYGASTTYHTFDISTKVNSILRKIDHMMIFVLITATYVPCCLVLIGGKRGTILLSVVIALSILGMIMNGLWITCPKWLSSIIYIALGWSCVFAFPTILSRAPIGAFLWLLTGGIFYTVGGVIYAIKIPVFGDRFRYFKSHELFHVFVLLGSLCHLIMMYCYLA